MSTGINYLHSHSGIEKEQDFPKREVLVDEEYKELFTNPEPYWYKEKLYYKVSTREFAYKCGRFKCLNE